ncbi:MAG: DUF2157 domain-containing protein [Elusimicrobiota bacterium]|nr:MAG: DUF2157 domain-containing protein [Elusimicrobiota bacterium]
MDELVSALLARGALTEAAARRIDELERRAHVPLARELHALLYLGALLILAGVGAAVKDKLDQIGPLTIAATLALGAAACLGWCAARARPFAPGRAEHPNAAFDYVLYLGCGLVGIFFSYLEWKWKVLGSWWDLYLLGSGLLAVALAYRMDNRLVLAAGLLNLAAFLGFRGGRWDWFGGHGGSGVRLALAAYGAALAGLGASVRDGELKPHFEPVYLSLGVHLGLGSLLVDATRFHEPRYWLLAAACAALGRWSLTRRRFDTFAAAVGYFYVATLASFLRWGGWHSFDILMWTVVFSAAGLIAVLLLARRSFKEEGA